MKLGSAMLLIASLIALPPAVQAHAKLLQSSPAIGATLSTAPDHFVLVFSESARLTALSIQRDGDADAQKIEPLPKEANVRFSVPAPKLAPGIYTLKFRNVASDDNHMISGSIRFTVKADSNPAVPAAK